MIAGDKIERLSVAAYQQGVHPVIVAEAIIEVVAAERGLGCAHCRTQLARQVVGVMLDCGWTMPGERVDQ